MTPVNILILAGREFEAKDFAKACNLPPDRWSYVWSVEKMHGIKDVVLLCVGTWYERKDKHEILETAKVRNFSIMRAGDL